MKSINEKKIYIKPEIRVIHLCYNYGVLDTLSTPVSDDEYDGEVM